MNVDGDHEYVIKVGATCILAGQISAAGARNLTPENASREIWVGFQLEAHGMFSGGSQSTPQDLSRPALTDCNGVATGTMGSLSKYAEFCENHPDARSVGYSILSTAMCATPNCAWVKGLQMHLNSHESICRIVVRKADGELWRYVGPEVPYTTRPLDNDAMDEEGDQGPGTPPTVTLNNTSMWAPAGPTQGGQNEEGPLSGSLTICLHQRVETADSLRRHLLGCPVKVLRVPRSNMDILTVIAMVLYATPGLGGSVFAFPLISSERFEVQTEAFEGDSGPIHQILEERYRLEYSGSVNRLPLLFTSNASRGSQGRAQVRSVTTGCSLGNGNLFRLYYREFDEGGGRARDSHPPPPGEHVGVLKLRHENKVHVFRNPTNSPAVFEVLPETSATVHRSLVAPTHAVIVPDQTWFVFETCDVNDLTADSACRLMLGDGRAASAALALLIGIVEDLPAGRVGTFLAGQSGLLVLRTPGGSDG